MTDTQTLIDALDGPHPAPARQQLVDLRAVGPVTTLLRQTRNPALKRSAITILQDIADPSAIPDLLRELADYPRNRPYQRQLLDALDAFDLTQSPSDLGFVVELMLSSPYVAAEVWRFGPRALALLARTAQVHECWFLAVESLLAHYPGVASSALKAALERLDDTPRVLALRDVLALREAPDAAVLAHLPEPAAIEIVAARKLHAGLASILSALTAPIDATLDAIIALAGPDDGEMVIEAVLGLLERQDYQVNCGGVDYRDQLDSPGAKIIHLLARYPEPRTVRALVALHERLEGAGCADEYYDIELALLDMGATAVDAMFAAWQDELGVVPQYGLDLLELMEPFETLLERLNQPGAFGREAAAAILGKLRFEAARDPLVGLLRYGDEISLRRAAATALVDLGIEADALLAALATEPDPATRQSLLENIGAIATPDHFETLCDLINDPTLRRAAFLALLEMIRRHPIGAREGQIINGARHDDDLIVRMCANALLIDIGLGVIKETTEYLLVRLKDYRLGDARPTLWLHKLRRDGDPSIMRQVVATPDAPGRDAALVTLRDGELLARAFLQATSRNRQQALLAIINQLDSAEEHFVWLLQQRPTVGQLAMLLPYIQQRHITAAIPILETQQRQLNVHIALAALGQDAALRQVVEHIRRVPSQAQRQALAIKLGQALGNWELVAAAHQIEPDSLLRTAKQHANKPLWQVLDRLVS